MRSADYLYDILKRSSIEGHIIDGKRFGICTKKEAGIWLDAVCQHRWSHIRVVGDFFKTREEAWEQFLGAKYPRILEKWKAKEEEA